jgi:hypothetical protein
MHATAGCRRQMPTIRRGWHTETASVVAENGNAWCTAPFVGHSIMRASGWTHS